MSRSFRYCNESSRCLVQDFAKSVFIAEVVLIEVAVAGRSSPEPILAANIQFGGTISVQIGSPEQARVARE